jgi:hypothetical protein
MAVFPDRIVLKNSSDSQSSIEFQIGSGGAAEITQGEIVIGLSTNSATFYTKDLNDNIVTIGSAVGSIANFDDLLDVDLTGVVNNSIVRYDSTSGNWEASTDLAGFWQATGDLVYGNAGITTRIPIGNSGDVLTVAGTPAVPTWQPISIVASIDDLTDVDTTTTPPTANQALVWNGSTWVPGTVATGGGGGGGGTGSGVLESASETETAASGVAEFDQLGASGIFVDVTSSLDAWIVFYPTAALRTADAGRAYGTDPATGSGVLAEFYVTAGGTVLASPGTTYFNSDTVGQEKIYAAVRDQSGANVNSEVTVNVYARRSFNGFGTNRVTDSGTASGGTLDLTGVGLAGQFMTVSSDLAAWIVAYGSSADRTADAARTFGTDPSPGSGVQAEFYVGAGGTVLATPGAVYFNNDTNPTEILYLAVRDQSGSNVNATVTLEVYAETSFTGVSGGTFGSG